LKSLGTSTVTVSPNTSGYNSKIAAFVTAYNGVNDFINAQYKLDANNKPTGVLAGDSTLRAVQQGLRDVLNATSTNNGALSNLSQLGISRNDTGDLTVDQGIFTDKLNNSLSDVQALFTGATTGSGLGDSLTSLSNSLSGDVQTSITGFTASIKLLNDGISAQQAQLNALRAQLTQEFAAADAAIGQLNGQGTTLTNILNALQPTTNKF
jgi:flagellar hook-associated protein 2